MEYKFKYKRRGLFSKLLTIKAMGHNYNKEEDRMDIFLASSKGLMSIGKWSECNLSLGRDFILFQKQAMEKAFIVTG